jgi:hypothetical protein
MILLEKKQNLKIFIYIIEINEIIFPIYSILIAIYSYSLLLPYYKENLDIFKRNLRLLVPFASICSGILNSLVAILIEIYPGIQTSFLGGNNVSVFSSLVFVLFLSPAMLYTAYYNHKQISRYIEDVEIPE